jgi:F-type H+-transporting ATPase subunit gamma
VNLPKIITYAEAEAIANPAVADFTEGKVDSVYLVYNEFKSVIAQKVVVEQLLPFVPEPAVAAQAPTVEYVFEPSPERILAAFFAAQMTAMDAATRNSREMMDSLTLYMNKLRQAAITREIIEVVSGAQAE